MKSTQATESTPGIRYQDCILGKIGAPAEKKQKTIFQLMLMASTVPITATINWVISTSDLSWGAFSQYLFMYPLLLIIAITVRFLVANPLIDKTVQTFIAPRLKGLRRFLTITLLNIFVMGTIVAFTRTVILAGGFEGFYWGDYASALPLSFLISFVFSYFIASPLTKKLFARTVESHIKVSHAAHGPLQSSSTEHSIGFKKPSALVRLHVRKNEKTESAKTSLAKAA